jgi:hypothetical protein
VLVVPSGASAAQAGAPSLAIIVLPPAGAATADIEAIDPYNTIGEYLRAAYAELLVEQALIEANVATAVAAGDDKTRDAFHSRLSACLLSQREVLRAIAIDDQREPYTFVQPPEASATASGSIPAVVTS